jgi:hypothetical protein
MQVSDYLKLRLDSQRINRQLTEHGLEITDSRIDGGMIIVIAKKPE